MSQQAIWRDLRPVEDKIDKRILYELSGIKLDEMDYKDDSSFEYFEDQDDQGDDQQSNDNTNDPQRVSLMQNDSTEGEFQNFNIQ